MIVPSRVSTAWASGAVNPIVVLVQDSSLGMRRADCIREITEIGARKLRIPIGQRRADFTMTREGTRETTAFPDVPSTKRPGDLAIAGTFHAIWP